MLKKNDLIDYFYKGIKNKNDLRIGVEHEKFVLKKDSLHQLSYEEPNGIKDILLKFVNKGWKPKYDDKNTTIIALERFGESITLEPGGQIELSGAQLKNIHQTCTETNRHLKELKDIGEEFGFILLGLGVEPSLSLDEFPWMPKQRYSIMKKYMPKVGTLGHHMMKRTCTNQVNLDYHSEEDMIAKYRLMLNLEGIATAIFANSPFDQKQVSKYKSLRSHFWHHTDKDRTGLLPFVFDKDFNFEKYVEYALDVPMYFVVRDKKYIYAEGQKFRDFLNGSLKCLPNEKPLIIDWENHLSTIFPEVRLKRFIEMRGADTGNWSSLCANPAFWVGLMYDKDSLDEASDLVADFSISELMEMREKVPIYGLDTRIRNNYSLNDLAGRVLAIAKKGLKNRKVYDTSGNDESIFLDILFHRQKKCETPADILIKSFNNEWSGDADKVFENNMA